MKAVRDAFAFSMCVLGVAAALGSDVQGSGAVAAEGKLSCSTKRHVTPLFRGEITSVNVAVGQAVKKGQVLASYRLTPQAEFSLRRTIANGEIAAMQRQLDEAENELLSMAEVQAEAVDLGKKGLVSDRKIRHTESRMQVLKRRRDSLAEWIRMESAIAADYAAGLARSLGVALDPLNFPKEVHMIAPIDGHVLSMSPAIAVNSVAIADAEGIMLGTMDPMIMRVLVYETESRDLRNGQQVDISLTALPGKTLAGKITGVSWEPTTERLGEPSYYQVEIEVPNPDLTLREGFRGRAVVKK